MTTSRAPRQGLLSFVRTFATTGLAVSAGIGGVFAYLSGDWIVFPAMILGWLFWRALPSDDAPPGLHFAFSFHLFQIIIGTFYTTITGRLLTPHQAPQYHLMMVLAVACLAAMFVGFLLGDRWLASKRKAVEHVALDVTLGQLAGAYLFALVFNDTFISFTEIVPVFAQAIYALSALQMGFFYLLVRRLFRDQRHGIVLLIVAFETIRGFSGFY
jgi:hypothetical protein